MNESKGILFVVSSPSGGGKSTIIRKLREKEKNLVYSISATTRKPRAGEKDGIDYFFMSRELFQNRIETNKFIEWALVHDEYYGTLWEQVNCCLADNNNLILDIDVQGGLNLKKKEISTILIFLLPPTIKVLESRLRQRGTESERSLKKRLTDAKEELKSANKYDFQVINNDLEETIQELHVIINECSRKNI